MSFWPVNPIGTSFFEATASGSIQVSALEIPLDPLLKSLLDEGEAAVIQLLKPCASTKS